jgi:hypothetical protein
MDFRWSVGEFQMSRKYDVATVLENGTQSTIDSWYNRVESESDLAAIPLSRADRCAHLPDMFRDLVGRLRNPLPLGTRALTSAAAHHHGCLRRDQGYTPAMIVEESRMLQVSIFQTLQLHVEDTEPGVLLLYVMVIADEVDSQLAQAMSSYVTEADHDAKPIEA